MTVTLYHEAPPAESLVNQILQIVKDNITALSMLSVPRSNITFPIYEWALPREIETYIERVGKYPHQPIELLVAMGEEDPHEVIGFALFSPVPTHPEACGINYMAVKRTNRRRGVGSSLVKALIARYPHTELTCTIKKVPFYESLGFQVIDSHNTQVVMNTRSESTDGLMAILNVAPLYESHEARLIQVALERQYGAQKVQRAIKDMKRHVAALEKQSRSFVKHRLSESARQSKFVPRG